MILSLIASFIWGIYKTIKASKKYDKSLLSNLIDAYDASRDEMERFRRVEDMILKARNLSKERNAKESEVKIAYIIKAQVESDMSTM